MKLNFDPLAGLYARIVTAKMLIDARCDTPLDLGAIASEACLSPYHFLRLFKRVYHKTPHQYLTERRIERAKQLMATTDMTITEICHAVGFEGLGSFSALFKKHAGCPPKEFRRHLWELNTMLRERPQQFIPHCFVERFGLEFSAPGDENSNSQ